MGGLDHTHIYTSRLPNTSYGVQIETESCHALANHYMGSCKQTIQSGEPSPAFFSQFIRISFPTKHPGNPSDNMKKMMK